MRITRTTALAALAMLLSPDWQRPLMAQDNPLTDGQDLNATQTSMADVAFEACSQRNPILEEKFRNRCDRLIGTAIELPGSTDVGGALFEVSPEQLASFGVETTRTMAGQAGIVSATVIGRLTSLQAALGTLQVAGLQFYQNGQPVTGGNAGSDAFGKLGVWLNVNYHLGELDSTKDLRGFNFDNWGFTAGADYQITESLVAGGAFTYITSDTDFDKNGGETDVDSYLGTLYGSFYPIENLYVNVLATYGHLNFDTSRKISYTLPNDVVNTKARGDTNANQWGVTVSSGYDLHWQSVNFTPYARFSYLRMNVDDYRENGGFGWGMEFNDQNIESMKSVAGAQASYAISLPFGVVTPQVRGEWHHEFRDPSRNIKASFLGDPAAQQFAIRVPAPDRDYGIVGGDISATFAYGISAFVGYEALVGYQNVSSHKITIGARMQF